MATVQNIESALSSLGVSYQKSSTKIELLEELKKATEHEIRLAKNNEVEVIARKVNSTNNDNLKLICEAMCHIQLSIKPKTSRLGYELANIDVTEVPKNAVEKELLFKVLKYLDVSHYVFSYTHYDEYSNGFYFRRS